MRAEHAELSATLFALQKCFEDLVVRGVRSAGPQDVQQLQALADELGRAGGSYVASVLHALVAAARESDPGAAQALLRAQTATRVLERVLSLDAAAEALATDAPPGAPAAPREPPALEDRKALIPLLTELAAVVEGLVASGLTTASAATQQKLDASAKEAARTKLGRLSASLRYVNDELGRFLAQSEHFSARRLAFFLNRTWLIARGLREAIDEDNRAALARLLWQSAPQPVPVLRLATVGVQKRALLDGSASFDFRLRVLEEVPGFPRGTRLVWSTVFGARKGVPAEAFLHLPQAQKFNPKVLLEPTQLTVTDAAVSRDDAGGGRLLLGPKSTVTPGPAVTAWNDFLTWSPEAALQRLRAHATSPLDLEIELQEEIVVRDWELGAPSQNPYRAEQQIFPLTAPGLSLDATVSTGPDGQALSKALKGFRAKGAARPALYGLLHYEMCKLVFQPLSAFEGEAGPTHLMIATDKIDLSSLMKTLDFTR